MVKAGAAQPPAVLHSPLDFLRALGNPYPLGNLYPEAIWETHTPSKSNSCLFCPQHAPCLPEMCTCAHAHIHCLILGPEMGGPAFQGGKRVEGQVRNWGQAAALQGGSHPLSGCP